ncbi:tyrosine-type recombinase/integrase [Streptomyces sp. NPDC054933]
MPAETPRDNPKGAGMPYVEWRGSTCRVRWDTGKINPETGRKIYDSKSGFTDEDEAYDYGLDRESDVRNDRYVSRQDGKILLRDWAEMWFASLDVDPSTLASYRSLLRSQIYPRWGDTALVDITTLKYNAWARDLRARYARDYARNILHLFSMIMGDAVDHRPPLIADSPVPKTNRRRGRYVRPQREEKNTVLTEDIHQLARNAHIVWGLPGYVFMLTKGFTGMRIGEMYGLRREFCYPNWPASDPDKQRRKKALNRYGGDDPLAALRVQWQHKYVPNSTDKDAPGTPTLALPKYGSERTLVIPPFLAELLEKLLDSHDSEWVFPSMNGGPLLTANFNLDYWQPVRDGAPERRGRFARAKIEAVEAFESKRIHLVRHAHKAHLDEDGTPRVAAEERLGHRLQGVEGVYSNVTVKMERGIAESLQARWESLPGDLRRIPT